LLSPSLIYSNRFYPPNAKPLNPIRFYRNAVLLVVNYKILHLLLSFIPHQEAILKTLAVTVHSICFLNNGLLFTISNIQSPAYTIPFGNLYNQVPHLLFNLVFFCCHGESRVNISLTRRTVSVGSDLYFNTNNAIRTLKVSRHPYSDTHLGIISSDSVFRLYDLSSALEQPEQEYYLQPVERGRLRNASSICPVDFSFG
ncbi:hypothetical protein Ccrd_004816, partial [Cynara cardunculus var. scolymus]